MARIHDVGYENVKCSFVNDVVGVDDEDASAAPATEGNNVSSTAGAMRSVGVVINVARRLYNSGVFGADCVDAF